MQYVQQIFYLKLTIIIISFQSKLELKPIPLSIMSLSLKPVSKPNYITATPPPKQVTFTKNNTFPNVIVIVKDLNQPNNSTEFPPPNLMIHLINNSSNNILISINIINVNSNIFYLFFYIKKFLAFSILEILMLTKI